MADVINALGEVLISVLEALAITALAYSLIGEKMEPKKLFLSALVTGIAMGAVKKYLDIPILPFIFHVLVYQTILSLSLYFLKVSSFWQVAAAVSFSIPIYLIIEMLNMGIRHYLKADVSIYRESFSVALFGFLPQFIVAVSIAWVFYRKKIHLFSDKDEEVHQLGK